MTETTHACIWQSLIFLLLKCSEIDHPPSLFDWIIGDPCLNLPEIFFFKPRSWSWISQGGNPQTLISSYILSVVGLVVIFITYHQLCSQTRLKRPNSFLLKQFFLRKMTISCLKEKLTPPAFVVVANFYLPSLVRWQTWNWIFTSVGWAGKESLKKYHFPNL